MEKVVADLWTAAGAETDAGEDAAIALFNALQAQGEANPYATFQALRDACLAPSRQANMDLWKQAGRPAPAYQNIALVGAYVAAAILVAILGVDVAQKAMNAKPANPPAVTNVPAPAE